MALCLIWTSQEADPGWDPWTAGWKPGEPHLQAQIKVGTGFSVASSWSCPVLLGCSRVCHGTLGHQQPTMMHVWSIWHSCLVQKFRFLWTFYKQRTNWNIFKFALLHEAQLACQSHKAVIQSNTAAVITPLSWAGVHFTDWLECRNPLKWHMRWLLMESQLLHKANKWAKWSLHKKNRHLVPHYPLESHQVVSFAESNIF